VEYYIPVKLVKVKVKVTLYHDIEGTQGENSSTHDLPQPKRGGL
jgi:hypothetical protein